MAAEVPVSDVLCEAMEYLSKLGSNLRTRSENLKEKRICKTKLKNAHAVQKAASKVLLICELSKKSLDNVETGVRKVLSRLEASQASSNIGGNTSDNKSRTSGHYIEYQSKKLRIPKKISLKHYMSVKVHAKGMSASMHDKYPVYYDCKLKRQRRRLAKKQKSELKTSNQTVSDKEHESEKSDTGEFEKLDDDNRNDESGHEIEVNNSQENVTDSELHTEDKTPEINDSQHKNEQKSTRPGSPINANEGKEPEHSTESDSVHNNISSVNNKVRKSSIEKCSDAEGSSDGKISDKNLHRKFKDQKARHGTHNKHDKENGKKKASSRSRYAAIYSSDSDAGSLKDKVDKNQVEKVNLCSDDENVNTNDSPMPIHRAKKKNIWVSDDSKSQADSDCGKKDLETENKNIAKDDLETENKNIAKDNNSDRDRESDTNSLDTKSCKDSQNESGGESKPLIRCVNLSKLLKPDILNIENHSKNDCNKMDPIKSKNSKLLCEKNTDLDKKEGKKDDKKRKQKKIDDKNWIQKRKEVNEFKAKKFSINIVKLPNFTENFLLTHNLRKIIQRGNTICELKNNFDTPNSKKIDEVKNALLNDSESDECIESADTNKVKKSLLKDSGSECDKSEKEENNETDSNAITKKQESIAVSINTAISNLDSDLEKNGEQIQVDSINNCTDTLTTEAQSQSVTESTNTTQIHKLSSEISTASNDNVVAGACQNENNKNDKDSNIQTNHDSETSTKTKHNTTCDDNEDEINKEIDSLFINLSSLKKFTECIENIANIPSNTKAVCTSVSSDEDFTGHSKSNQETPSKVNEKHKSSSLNDLSDEGFAGFSKDDLESPTKIIQSVKSSLLNDSSDENPHKKKEEASAKTNDEVKSSLLNNSSGDDVSSKDDKETPTKTNDKVKTSLLKDSTDEKSDGSDKDSITKANEKGKSSQHNESSDVNSDASEDRKEKRKTPKSKRKHARKSRESKKRLRYASSSDSEEEKHRHKRIRKKSNTSSTSSSSEKVTNKYKKAMSQEDESYSSYSDKKTAGTINQVDGPIDEQSNSSIDKMVRSKAKPSGSSSQNSDNQDATDKDIDGLTNLNNLNKNRRRDHSAKSREDKDTIKKNSRSKETPIIGEDLLKAESSSDASDVGDNEFEELPPVMLSSGLNGDSIDHMAKDDLLGESDSSISHNDKDQTENTDNMDETDGEENLKSKRRKANAISSDSEGGSHRRKPQEEERMSDFEDSEDEGSETGKKSKRKKKASDSDGSVDSNDGGKKKRRRIKIVRDSDASGSDTENEGRNKHGRKNIRKVMGKNQLEEATKKAAREEKERIARITERQKLYNNLDFDESGKPDEVVLEKVILDFDPETKEPLIQVDRGLVKKLKPHQANGIKFMWDACFESVKRIKRDKGSGCILAHCMGLGKTLQVISLTHTLLTHGSLTGVNRVLVVCPLSTVLNWVNEIRMWLKHAEAEFDVDVYELSRYKQNSERAFQLQQWLDCGGVCVLGYEMFRNLSADNPKKFKKKMLRSFQESLVDPGPDLVVCDEGHLLKNEKTSLSQSMNRIKTRRRIVLTGTPLQNNLKEYYCMVQFVKPNLLGKYNEYLNRFVNPITNGQYTDSTEHDIRIMKRRSHVLHKMLDGAVQRRDYGVLAPFLPPKHEYVLFITLTDVQVKLYQFYLDNYSRRPLPGKSSGFLFPDFQSLQRIWTHPLVLKYNSERYEIMQQKKREREEEDSEGSLVDFIDDDSTPDESSTEESSDDLSDVSDDSRKKNKKKKASKKAKGKETKASTRRGTRANPIELDDEENDIEEVVEVKYENPTEWWIKLVEETELDDLRNSHKLVLLFDILRQCETIGDKLLVFSQSLYSLDLIEHFLGKVDEATQEGRIDEKLGGHVGSWSPGVDYFRLDGSTSCENRSIWCKNFNREDNPRARLFLISTRAGGLGINLVAANRVIIFDVSWNPSHDVQSIFRVYRFGQKKPCYVYRFLAMGTMEEKIYERQVTKQAISKRVIDEQQIDRHYAENDLAELYKFEARPDEPRPLPTLPKDRLFAEMLKEHEAQIYKYHEHDSLLENKEEETLSEEERKAAWEDFENEKNKPPPAPFPTAWPMHNGMDGHLLVLYVRVLEVEHFVIGLVPGLLAQQQQQLAYAALAAMLRKDMPNINDNQIRDMLPLIYNSNPGLMQKMSEIYKYAQPSMMNPSMMNPVMNAGGGGGMGGTSGLQYEPPWQRQHQQQQQMRLQQLMQHQNQMGAKFYAGGLGSRDPVAMALQQQRAREIMMGGGGAGGGGPGAGRPRGRPPIHPRGPSATSPDVVNLDSD